MPRDKDGYYWEGMTVRDLYTELHNAMTADSGNPAWDEKLDIRPDEGGFAFAKHFTVEDVTDECEGDCDNPQCVYAVTDPEIVRRFETGEDVPGYLDEGLHLRPTLWLHKPHAA